MQDAGKDLAGMRILIIEDQFVVAMDLAETLRDLHCDVLKPAPTVEAAIAALRRGERIDGVLLDLNLRGRDVLPVIDELSARNIAFVVMSGYAPRPADSPVIRAAPRLNKPVDVNDLVKTMLDAFIP